MPAPRLIITLSVMAGWTRSDYRPEPKHVRLASMRAQGVRDLLIYCGNPARCRHSARLDADRWPDDVTFGEIEVRMLCTECGHRGADVRPGWGVLRDGRGAAGA